MGLLSGLNTKAILGAFGAAGTAALAAQADGVITGNEAGLAVGVVIGAAFGKIVNSLVANVIMPVLGLGFGRVDFANRFVSLNGEAYATLAAAREAGAPVLAYGAFINTVVEFLVVAFSIFLVVRQVNKLRGDMGK